MQVERTADGDSASNILEQKLGSRFSISHNLIVITRAR